MKAIYLMASSLILLMALVPAAILIARPIDLPGTYIMALPAEMATGTDMECQNAVHYVDAVFESDPAIERIRFTNTDWLPFANPLSRSHFYGLFMDCLIHDGVCWP